MDDKIILLNSNDIIDENAKLLNPDMVVYGELGVNYHKNVETISTKNDMDEIAEFVPYSVYEKEIGSIGSEIFCESDEPSGKTGDMWVYKEPPIPLTLEFTTTAPNEEVKLPCQGRVNITVDWGDGGTKESFTSDNPTHSYNNIGVYTVKIIGDFTSMYGCSPNVTKVISWGNSNTLLTNMGGTFGWCSKLTSIPGDDYGQFVNVTNFGQMFRNCSGLICNIPENLFSSCRNVTDFFATFSGCRGLTGAIPENLFANCPNVTTFESVFQYCDSLTDSIPENLFKNNPNVTSFYRTFMWCEGLTGDIPKNLFNNHIKVTNFGEVFRGCLGLTGYIPSNLFMGNPNVTSFSMTFYGCGGLTGSIPEKLFVNNPNVTSFQNLFTNCSNLTGTIPENLFVHCPNVTLFGNAFAFCSGLTGSIPENLFTHCPNVTDFSGIFQNCSNISSIAGNLFENCINVIYFHAAFKNCYNLTGTTPTDADGGQLWERQGKPGYPSTINGAECFRGCNGLSNYTSIPSNWK